MAKANAKQLKKIDWPNRIIRYAEQPASQFLAHPDNARRHPGKQRDALRGSLNAVGWIAPVIVSGRTGKVLDGHARIEEALTKDENALVPYVTVSVSEDEERFILASFDPISAMAEYDKEALDALLRQVSTEEAAVAQMLSDVAKKEGLYKEKYQMLTASEDGATRQAEQPVLQERFPLAIVLTAPEQRRWRDAKDAADATTDKQFLLLLLEKAGY